VAGCCECGDEPSGSCATELGLSLVETDQRFKRTHCVHHQDDEHSETSLNFHETTKRNILEDSHLQTTVLDLCLDGHIIRFHLLFQLLILMTNNMSVYTFGKCLLPFG
jgi:hypothetical protein